VRSVLEAGDAPTLRAARPPVPIWVDDYRLLWAAGGAVSLLLLALLALFALRRRPVAEEPAAPVVLRPADEVALEKLRALAKSRYLESGEYMIFYVRMSEAVREYLGRRYGFPGLELTNAEILDRLRAVQWPVGLELRDIARWLDHCDFVKFSGAQPATEQAREHLKKAFTLVELTRRAPEADAPPSPPPAPSPAPSATPARPELAPSPEPSPEPETPEAP
jgi:hypothetical protein